MSDLFHGLQLLTNLFIFSTVAGAGFVLGAYKMAEFLQK